MALYVTIYSFFGRPRNHCLFYHLFNAHQKAVRTNSWQRRGLHWFFDCSSMHELHEFSTSSITDSFISQVTSRVSSAFNIFVSCIIHQYLNAPKQDLTYTRTVSGSRKQILSDISQLTTAISLSSLQKSLAYYINMKSRASAIKKWKPIETLSKVHNNANHPIRQP